ncbi:hypothetical protein AMTRI_Chr03g144960 [Amborella trichopoda]
MVLSNAMPDSITLSVIISAWHDVGNPNIGKSVYCWRFKRGFGDAHISIYNSLISFYSKINDIEYACKVFEGLVSRDLVSWNSMINAFVENERVLVVFGFLEEMETDGFKLDSVTVVTLISACSKSKLLEHGQFIHEFVIRRELGLDLNVINSLIDMYTKCSNIRSVSYSTLIAAFASCDCLESLAFGRLIHSWEIKSGFPQNVAAQNGTVFIYINCGNLESGLSMFEDISVRDVVSSSTVIVGCAQNGFAKKPWSIWVHVYVLKTGLEFNLHLINALLSMYYKCKDVKSANLIFGSIPNQRNLYSWNSMISSYSHNKQPHKARELFYQMNFEPNKIPWLFYLHHIHDYITQNGFEQNAFICTALIDMYNKCGKLEEAIQIFKDVRERSIVCWNAMIGAYGLHGYGGKALSLFSEMLSLGVKPNESTFISVLRACSHSDLVSEYIILGSKQKNWVGFWKTNWVLFLI